MQHGGQDRCAELWNERIEIARTQGMDALVDGVIARWFSDDFAEREPERVRSRRARRCWRPIRTDTPASARRYATAISATSVQSITTPTLVIGGIRDQAAPIEQSRWLHEQIADSRLVELDAAHLSNLDREREFTAALEQFLDDTTPRLGSDDH